ncbi:hypothetical protein D3C76_871100 [compost metagenome]
MELHLVPSLELAQLPKIRFDHRHRAHETAQAWAVRAEDHRHVTGEIHSADGIWIVVNVRRMQTGFTTVGTHPLRLRPDQAHTRSAGIEVHFPLRGEEGADVVFREVFRCAVWAVDHADLPYGGQLCDFRQLRTDATVVQRRQMQHITRPQGTTAMPAKLTEGKGAFAPQIIRNLQATAHAQIAARTSTGDRAEAQRRTGRNQ